MRLVALDDAAIRALNSGSPVVVDGLQVRWPRADARVLRYRVEALDQDPGAGPYLLHVLLDGAEVAGRIGCHAAPVDGVVEIGYSVTAPHRGRGVATAMVSEFLGWLGARGVRRVRAAVGPENAASRAVLARFGFAEVAEHWDDEDGRELLLERALMPAS